MLRLEPEPPWNSGGSVLRPAWLGSLLDGPRDGVRTEEPTPLADDACRAEASGPFAGRGTVTGSEPFC